MTYQQHLTDFNRLADLDGLRAKIRGAVYGPGETGYDTVGFNVTAVNEPTAVIDVADARDVAAVIAFAGEHGMTVGVRATGHAAIDTDRRSLLVRTGALDTCEVDPADRTARVGAGVRWQQVIDAAAPHGLAPVCGSAPGVGVVGLLSGGGVGPLVRTFGLSADYVRSFEVVTGDGVIRRAAPDENAELFWGLRGGKATLGLITEVVIELPELSEMYAGAIYFDGADAAVVLDAWRVWAPTLSRSASTSVALMRLPELPGVPPMLAGRFTVAVRYASVAPASAAAAELASIRSVAAPILDAVGPMPYAAIGAIHADPVDPMPVHEAGMLLGELTDEAVQTLVGQAGPDAATTLLMVELRQLGGALADEPAVHSAYCHRDAAYNLHTVGVLVRPIEQAVVADADRLVDAMRPWATGGRMPNFVSSADPAVIRTCYDDDTVAWLAALARQHDPRGVLAVGQVVR
ncbi:FAD-binding oxidoreductase [Jongsikchunia kroppenstedtii]|uniref:FAD-binding oxidoreductase n=1 Tax=Jongsikchunia kroppenstedtii TaxID=1121721 RepID=UPI0003702310|nr:FAD-binding protein [Jongsikchunia kroppenstedtii]